MSKECKLSTGKLPLGGLPRNSVVRINDHPDMTSARIKQKITISQCSFMNCICFINLTKRNHMGTNMFDNETNALMQSNIDLIKRNHDGSL